MLNFNILKKGVLVFVALFATAITGCATMDTDSYSYTPAPVPPEVSLLSEGQAALNSGNYKLSEDKFQQILDKKLCVDANNIAKICLPQATLGLAQAYDREGQDVKALPMYKAVADTRFTPPYPVMETMACTANISAGDISLNGKKFDDAFKFYDAATNKSLNCGEKGFGDRAVHGIVLSAKGMKNPRLAKDKLKPIYLNSPTSAMYNEYKQVLQRTGDKTELAKADKFQDEVMFDLERFDKLYTPADMSDNNAVIQFYTSRASVYGKALQTTKKLGLLEYDDFLIGQVRQSQQAVASIKSAIRSQQDYERALADQARQNAQEDQDMLNFMGTIIDMSNQMNRR